jgi:hypothetical protein
MMKPIGTARTWKGFDWDTLDRLYEKGWIFDPKNKAKSNGSNRSGYIQ